MHEHADIALLAEFARNQSEAAFAELVRRHLNLVYSVALRHTDNPQHAQEITQAVFIILARKASSLGRKMVLSGWLYHTARLTAANYRRAEFRRVRREQEAYMQSTLEESPANAIWNELAPQLDEAMAGLGTVDRDAVVLRYFQNKSLQEVGAALGLDERAAQKRVARALEKLRKIFAQRGVALSTASLAGAISAHSVSAAPVALAASTLAVTGGSAVVAASTLTLVKGALNLMTISKIQLGVISAVVVAGLTTPLVFEHRANAKLREENLALQRKGEQSAVPATERPTEMGVDAAELERLRKEHSELLKLRGEMGRLRAVEQELAKLKGGASRGPNTAATATPGAAMQELPKDGWSDAGFGTPMAALQTRGWAVLNASRDRFKESIHITDGAKKLLDAMIEGMITASPEPAKMREQIRAQGLTLEDGVLFPMMAENRDKGYAGYRVLSQESPTADQMVLEVETQMTSAPAKKETLKMQQIDGAWKVVIDEAAVQAEINKGKGK